MYFKQKYFEDTQTAIIFGKVALYDSYMYHTLPLNRKYIWNVSLKGQAIYNNISLEIQGKYLSPKGWLIFCKIILFKKLFLFINQLFRIF